MITQANHCDIQTRGSDLSEQLVIGLTTALHTRGIPAHRLEASIVRVSGHLNSPVQVFATPTAVQLAFDGEPQRIHFIRAEAGDVDLSQIAGLSTLIDGVIADRFTAGEALIELRRSDSPAARPRAHRLIAAFTVVSAAAACLFGGALLDSCVAGLLAMGIGGVSLLPGSANRSASVIQTVAAGVVTWTTLQLAALGLPIDPNVVILSALIVLVPGFTLTVAISELAERHLASGTARLAGAAMTFLMLGLGVALGRALVGGPGAASSIHAAVLPLWAVVLAAIAAPLAFAVLFNARRCDVPWVLATSLIGYAATSYGIESLGPHLGVFVGAGALGLTSHTITRWIGVPVSATQVPGIMLLVPGSLGFRSVAYFVSSDALAGMQAGFEALIVAVALVGGLLVANVILPPHRAL
jgi:uncharacterized membrane protein YjjP (DUF1212 family)